MYVLKFNRKWTIAKQINIKGDPELYTIYDNKINELFCITGQCQQVKV
jgi:hypothetical protein